MTALALGLASLSPSTGGDSLSAQVRYVEPQVLISIEHVAGTGDVVQIRFESGVHDENSARAGVASLGTATGSQIEGFQFISGSGPKEKSKVFFVAQGLVDPSTGDIRLQPIVRSFMAGVEGVVESFSVRIVGQSPSAYKTLAKYTSEAVVLRAFYDAATPSIDFRILVTAKDPALVEIPPHHISDETVTQVHGEPGGVGSIALLALILLAGGSAGALVYFALLG